MLEVTTPVCPRILSCSLSIRTELLLPHSAGNKKLPYEAIEEGAEPGVDTAGVEATCLGNLVVPSRPA